MHEYLLTCPRGLEDITCKQISKHIKNTPTVNIGSVRFKGDKEDMYAVNLHSRTGMHLLKKIFSFSINNSNELYDNIYHFDWEKVIGDNKTFVIKTKSKSSLFNNTSFITLKIKDAIVDKIRKHKGKRPSINKINPDIILFVLLNDNNISIDSSGEPLYKRGYRTVIHKAALNESLAAGLILLSNWDKKNQFYDIMCGSGTIPLEAAMIAYNIPPGIFRGKFAFQKWNNYNHSLWISMICKAKDQIIINKNIEIYGSDYLNRNIQLGIESSKIIGVGKNIKFSNLDIKDFNPRGNKGTIIINPPYGIRLGDQSIINKLYKQIGDLFKTRCSGYDTYIFTGNLDAIKSIGLRSKKRIILKNGRLDCRLLYYPILPGGFK
jgi:putative N6-adenine-specific DNA methylase